MSHLKDYSDEELWKEIQQDNDRAFDELFERHWKRIHVFALNKTKSKEATADIIQDLFSSLWQRRHAVEVSNVFSYLNAAAKYKCIDFITSEIEVRRSWEYFKKCIPEIEETTLQAIEFNDLMNTLEKSLDQLPEKSKQIFTESRFGGKSVRELSRIFNVTEKGIEYHITQSLKVLKLHLKDFYVFIAMLSVS
jgi:RNA polymerase sigma-70 factor (ECF subfamily)